MTPRQLQELLGQLSGEFVLSDLATAADTTEGGATGLLSVLRHDLEQNVSYQTDHARQAYHRIVGDGAAGDGAAIAPSTISRSRATVAVIEVLLRLFRVVARDPEADPRHREYAEWFIADFGGLDLARFRQAAVASNGQAHNGEVSP
jgi:hypothetical protein